MTFVPVSDDRFKVDARFLNRVGAELILYSDCNMCEVILNTTITMAHLFCVEG